MKNTGLILLLAASPLVFCGSAGIAAEVGQKSTSAAAKLSLTRAENSAMDKKHRLRAAEMINGGLEYLISQQDSDGGWSLNSAFKPAVTALVLKALLQHPDMNVETPIVSKGFDLLLSYQQGDGAIYDPKQGRSNYSTAIAVCALTAARKAKFKPNIDQAVKYLRSLQIIPGSESPDGKEIYENHPFMGGVSYGRHGRPDINNVGWWMEAMHDAGVAGDDPAMQRALLFVTRCQNRSESNPLVWAKEGDNDGGFIYAPGMRDITVGESKAGKGPGGRGLRSYGSAGYNAWKSMLYAGLTKDDPRVRAVYGWIRRYWTLDANPNMPKARDQQGMYFYYLVFARALRAWGQNEIPAIRGDAKHNWREELVDALDRRVRPDGSWANPSPRWGEGNPVLVTTYEVQALQETLKK